jgi:ubiquinone/menaquinone biosynthesis C-methylase UbiE
VCSGAAAIALSGEFSAVVGIGWNLADLILFRKRLEELKISNVILAQANLLRQPFADNTFDYATALNVIEHMLDVKRGFSEIARTLRPAGCFCGDPRNRFDILFPEPHVKLRFLGFLPRQWAKAYVKWRRGLAYENTRLLSYWELRRTLATHFANYHIAYPGIDAC